MTDLFGHTASPAEEPRPKRGPGLKVRIWEFLKEHRFQSYTANNLCHEFEPVEREKVLKAIEHLKKTQHIIGTGGSKGIGIHNQCLIANPHKKSL